MDVTFQDIFVTVMAGLLLAGIIAMIKLYADVRALNAMKESQGRELGELKTAATSLREGNDALRQSGFESGNRLTRMEAKQEAMVENVSRIDKTTETIASDVKTLMVRRNTGRQGGSQS